jgi:hypothetical protein
VGLDSRLNQVSNIPSRQAEHLYWVCFRDYDDSFIGVVICRGTSPGAAANNAINAGLVESEKATISQMPEEFYPKVSKYMDRLLGEDMTRFISTEVGISLIETSKKLDI